MATGGVKVKRILIGGYLIVVHLALVYLIGERVLPGRLWITPLNETAVSDPTEPKPVATPLPVPDLAGDLPPTPPEAAPGSNTAVPPPAAPEGELIVPVLGVSREQLIDSYAQSRSEGRTHDAIDIPAPLGTPVIAAADGRIVKFWDSEAGGITIYQLSADGKYVYYYAHLQRRAAEIKEGDSVRRGATIGYVGDSGNAGAGNYHLHFSIAAISDPKRYWTGTYINPYPLLNNPGRTY